MQGRMEEEYDLVVVGGGVYGLPVPKTYLEVNPTARVLLLDHGQSIGGTWSAERLYEGLYSNNVLGSLEYSDFPMDFDTFSVPPGSHIPGSVIHKYLNAYVDHFGFRDRIRLGATVRSAELMEDGSWLVQYDWKNTEQDAKDIKLITKKLVLATGTASQPNMPSLAGRDDFGAPLFHSLEFAQRTDDMNAAKTVAVLGGSKSAADAVYLNASQGRHVDWIIRASGKGPAFLTAPLVSPLKLLFEKLTTTRFMSFLYPSFDLDSYPTVRKFFHSTRIGRAILRGILGIINGDIIASSKYNKHPETKKLKPRSNIFWWGTTVGVFNYPTDLFDLVRKGLVHVHITDIASLSDHTVHFSDGDNIEADALICATGYKQTPTLSILPSHISHKIGVSAATPDDPTVKAADVEIMRRFPELKNQPPVGFSAMRDQEQASYALYRGTIPPAFIASRNLAYCGMAFTLKGFLTAQTQALWITAFLDGQLSTPLPSEDEAEWQAMLMNRFWRWRAPNGLGPKSADMVFEIMPFIDTLLRDLGLKTARKNSWWKELFESYGVADYPQIVQEWMEKQKLEPRKCVGG